MYITYVRNAQNTCPSYVRDMSDLSICAKCVPLIRFDNETKINRNYFRITMSAVSNGPNIDGTFS